MKRTTLLACAIHTAFQTQHPAVVIETCQGIMPTKVLIQHICDLYAPARRPRDVREACRLLLIKERNVRHMQRITEFFHAFIAAIEEFVQNYYPNSTAAIDSTAQVEARRRHQRVVFVERTPSKRRARHTTGNRVVARQNYLFDKSKNKK